MNALKEAVQEYARRHADRDGLAPTSVPGLRMMRVEEPGRELHSTYRPLVCVILQGAKHLTVGLERRLFVAGQSVIVSADMPVTGRIVKASRAEPYLAVAVELDMAVLREIAVQFGREALQRPSVQTLLWQNTDQAALGCATRLMQLLDHPYAVPILHPGIMRELHYWLLSGSHGSVLRALALPESYASRLAAAIAILRAEYRSRLPIERLAGAAAMSLTAFHKHFKQMTSLTPGQFQKRLRLIEARRLMLDKGSSASHAAFEVGYESVSQFTREYARLFKAPPKRDALRARDASRRVKEGMRKGEPANAA